MTESAATAVLPPHSHEAEMGTLGSILCAPDACLDRVAQALAPEDFFHPPHGTILRTMLELQNEGKPVEFITLTQKLRDIGQLENVGGPSAISTLYTFTPTAANVGHYIEIVKEKARLRQAIRSAGEIKEAAYAGDATADGIESMIQNIALDAAKSAETGRRTPTIKQLAIDAVARLEARYEGRAKLQGITSGIEHLDKKTFGWRGGQMIVIAAQDKAGKSSLARQFALAALQSEEPVNTGYFSLEMGAREITDALIAQKSKINARRIEAGTMTSADFDVWGNAAMRIGGFPLFIRDEADMNMNQFRAAARVLKLQEKVGLIIVDYLQLLEPNGKHENRQTAVSEISRGLKLCAKELDIPIIVLCQLNEDGKTRESRAIQMDLDVLITVEHQGGEPAADAEFNNAWLNVKRHRGGPTGRTPVLWRGPITTFEPRTFDDDIDKDPDTGAAKAKREKKWGR